MTRRSKRNLTIRGAVAAAALAVTTACPPPEPAPPSMPDGIGVEWLQDVAGTTDEFGHYRPVYGRFRLLDGVRTGPGAVDPSFVPLAATAGPAHSAFDVPVFPDGSARFPWNGFAGEGITTSTMLAAGTTTYDVVGPSGSCSFTNTSSAFATWKTIAAIPSPDGTKLAVYRHLRDFDANTLDTEISIVALADCTAISTAAYHRTLEGPASSGEWIYTPLAVWSPTSSAVLFTVADAGLATDTRVVRLDATGGATPSTAYWPVDVIVIPHGWSTADRMLVVNASADGTEREIRTVSITGGAGKLVDRWGPGAVLTEPGTHFGYYVPGTTTVVYSDASRTAVNAQDQTVVWPRFRLYDDATGASVSLTGTDSPLTWHSTPSGDRVNIELIERFVR